MNKTNENVLGLEKIKDLDPLAQQFIKAAATGLDKTYPDVQISRKGDVVNIDAIDKDGAFIAGFGIDVSGPKEEK